MIYLSHRISEPLHELAAVTNPSAVASHKAGGMAVLGDKRLGCRLSDQCWGDQQMQLAGSPAAAAVTQGMWAGPSHNSHRFVAGQRWSQDSRGDGQTQLHFQPISSVQLVPRYVLLPRHNIDCVVCHLKRTAELKR